MWNGECPLGAKQHSCVTELGTLTCCVRRRFQTLGRHHFLQSIREQSKRREWLPGDKRQDAVVSRQISEVQTVEDLVGGVKVLVSAMSADVFRDNTDVVLPRRRDASSSALWISTGRSASVNTRAIRIVSAIRVTYWVRRSICVEPRWPGTPLCSNAYTSQGAFACGGRGIPPEIHMPAVVRRICQRAVFPARRRRGIGRGSTPRGLPLEGCRSVGPMENV